ncbi:MAG: Phosphoribosylanthranilate isomerase [Lacunisphaera sp.]|jgi:phosphoribosylanthranilate isomerase|nr:Phosphoribosylanthranilate isomerase [Lacunisphaera sp.]MDB6166160.1 Phosphoribosylanthranilate isomerase [Lacunisphaera sp.]
MSARKPFVKICCIKSAAEARRAIAHGADALGLVSHMPSGPGPISDELIAEIAATIPPPVATFLLTSLTDTDAIIEQQRRCRPTTLQLVDALIRGTHADLRRALPGIRIVQVIHIRDEASVAEAARLAPEVDALLLDSGNPGLAVKELGGTGRVHNWALSRRIVETCGKPVFLAGGLRAENLAPAWAEVRPHGFDVCSGVRTNDVLDETKLAAFFGAMRSLP